MLKVPKKIWNSMTESDAHHRNPSSSDRRKAAKGTGALDTEDIKMETLFSYRLRFTTNCCAVVNRLPINQYTPIAMGRK